MIFIEIQNWTLKEIFPQITKIELDLHVLYKDNFSWDEKTKDHFQSQTYLKAFPKTSV